MSGDRLLAPAPRTNPMKLVRLARWPAPLALAVCCLLTLRPDTGPGEEKPPPGPAPAPERPAPRVYHNRLTPLKRPGPLLADHPEFVEPVRETTRFEAPAL